MIWKASVNGQWNPWTEMDRLHRRMDRVVDRMDSRRWIVGEYPAVNLWARADQAILTAEVPGVSPEKIDITVKDKTVTLRCQRHPDDPADGQRYVRRERRVGSFVRSFILPFPVDAGRVTATCEQGILRITLPRAESDKPKRITVQAG